MSTAKLWIYWMEGIDHPTLILNDYRISGENLIPSKVIKKERLCLRVIDILDALGMSDTINLGDD